MYVCNCHGLTETDMDTFITLGETCEDFVAEIKYQPRSCCKCIPKIKEIFNKASENEKIYSKS